MWLRLHFCGEGYRNRDVSHFVFISVPDYVEVEDTILFLIYVLREVDINRFTSLPLF